MSSLYNRARVNTSTAGTGTITLGAATSNAFFTFAEAGVPDGIVVSYVIEDGSNVELGIGTYTASGTTLSRDTVTISKISGTAGTTKLTLSGSAIVYIDALAADLPFSTSSNNFFGPGAGNKTSSSASENVGIGLSALSQLDSGALNVAIGNSALAAAQNTNNCMAVGYQALKALSGGFGNSAIGTQALLAATSSNYNTAIGYSAGALATGSNNTIIGAANTGTPGPTSGANNIMIGAGVDLPSATTDNQIVIGNIIYGTGASGTGATVAGSIGIGTPSPDRRFHAEQDSAATNSITYVGRLTSTSTGTPANGIGVGAEFEVEAQAGVNKVGGTIENYAYNVGAGTESFDTVFKTMSAGAAATEKGRTGFMPVSMIQTDSFALQANYSMVVSTQYAIPTGVTLTMGANSVMRIL